MPQLRSALSVLPIRDAFLERHFTVRDLAEAWVVSENTIRRLFRNEPGVVEVDNTRRKHARRHVTLRIPHSVAERVYARIRRA
jgi:transcriptional regulator GlxA family with amidase domain